MHHFSRRGLVLAILSAAACGSSSSNTPATPALTVTANVDAGAVSGVTNGVKANGSNSVTINISGGTTGPIKLTTHKGAFSSGGQTAMIQGTSGSVVLFTCNARTDASCAGTTSVSATDASFAFGQVSVDFVGFETNCSNGVDDNRDGHIDCADPDCDQVPCTDVTGNSGSCQSGVCMPPVCTPTAASEICDNGLDDDCDGKIDCAEASCDGQACKIGAPGFACKNRVCVDVTTGFGLTVTAKRARLPANGTATTTVTAKIVKMGVAQPGQTLDFSTDFGNFVVGAATPTETTVTSGGDGTATVTFQASASSGQATITVALHDLPQVKQTATVTMPTLGSISLGTIQNPVMGVKFSGFNEQTSISVLLLDTEQKPYPDGLAVRFEHQQLAGSTISTPFTPDTPTCLQALGCLGYLGVTTSPPDKPDSQGLAFVDLRAGTAAGPVSVSATTTAGGITRSFTVQNMAVVGAKASGLHVALSCTPLNVPGFVHADCTNAFYSGPGDTITCTVFLADRFNNVLGVATRADFRTEAGAAGPPVVTKAYDPSKGGDQTATLGHVSDTVLVTGYRLPANVEPIDGEFNLFIDTGTGCGKRWHNPRSGLSTVIVAVQGEEGFVDINANGVYDSGEPFVDSGEPFVDENDNNTWDEGELFIDVNQNGKWDGPNGVWDANTVVWAEARVLYSGPATTPSRWMNAGDIPLLPDVTPGVTFSVSSSPPTTQGFTVFFSDENFNPLASSTTYSIASLLGNVSPMYSSGPSKVDSLGMSFTQLFCDQPAGTAGTCASTCKSSPCYRVTTIGAFGYGTLGTASITGAKSGPDTVVATSNAGGVDFSIQITGSSN